MAKKIASTDTNWEDGTLGAIAAGFSGIEQQYIESLICGCGRLLVNCPDAYDHITHGV